MYSFLGFIFIFILVIILFGVSIISSILRALFGLGRRSSSRSNSSNTQQQADADYNSKNKNRKNSSTKRKKIFDDDEGEYVEFEEIKD